MLLKEFVKTIYKKDVVFIDKEVPVKDAMHTMIEHHVNALIVADHRKHVLGVLSLQDIAGAIVLREMQDNVALAQALFKPGLFEEMCHEIGHKKVADVMRTNYITVTPETNILEIAADFLQRDLYIVPVLDDRQEVIGIVTRTEIKQAIAECMGVHAS